MVTTHTSKLRTITLTNEAVDVLKQFASKIDRAHWGLKFADEVSACGEGFNYIIDLVPSPDEKDEVFWFQGIAIYVPKESVERLAGSVIEYHTQEGATEESQKLLKKCFHVNNPNAKGPCPCACGDGAGY